MINSQMGCVGRYTSTIYQLVQTFTYTSINISHNNMFRVAQLLDNISYNLKRLFLEYDRRTDYKFHTKSKFYSKKS